MGEKWVGGVGHRWQRNQTPIQKQNKLWQTKHRGVYQKKKKKIPNTQTKTKPQ